jgi:hypothetical protein
MHHTATAEPAAEPAAPPQTHQLLMHQDVATLIKNTNSWDYKWIPRQLKSYFQKRNVGTRDW